MVIALRQMRTLNISPNKLLHTFYHCSIDFKFQLFIRFCTLVYRCYLWTAHKKSTIDKLRWHLTMLIVVFSTCHGDPVSAQCMLTLAFKVLRQLLEVDLYFWICRINSQQH